MPSLASKPIIDCRIHEIVSPEVFLNIVRTEKEAIRNFRFILPELETLDFAKFYIEYYYVPKSRRSKFPKWLWISDTASKDATLRRQNQKLSMEDQNILQMENKMEYEVRLAEQALKYKTIHLHVVPRNKA